MDERLEKSFVEEMRDALRKHLSEFELAKKREKIVSDEGRKQWLELKHCVKRYRGNQ
jgi:hypothetical protein